MRKIFTLLVIAISATSFCNAQSERIFLFDNFAKGAVHFKSGAINASLMNYDANNGKMYFMQGQELMELVGAETIDSICFGERVFLQRNGDFQEKYKMQNGEVKILWRINKIHAGYVGAFGNTSQVHSQKVQLPGNFGMGDFTTNGGGGMYNGSFGVNNKNGGGINRDVWHMKTQNTYFFTKDGKEYKIKRSKDILKAFPEKKEEIKQYISDNKLGMLSADDFLNVIDFVQSL